MVYERLKASLGQARIEAQPLLIPVMFSTVVLEVYVESGWLIGVKSAEATDAKSISATNPTDFFSNPERNMGGEILQHKGPAMRKMTEGEHSNMVKYR